MYPKLHHGTRMNSQAVVALNDGWAEEWKAAGFEVIGWGWLESDTPEIEADLAVNLCREYGLAGYIGNAEDSYELEGYWKSRPFVERFRERAPYAPLGLSYIGEGFPYRVLDFAPWIDAGAALLPQCYWGTTATSIDTSLAAIDRLGAPRDIVFPTLGTSAFPTPYPAEFYRAELDNLGQAFSVWTLESTPDDYLRALAP